MRLRTSLLLIALSALTLRADIQFDVTQTSGTYQNSSPISPVSWLPTHLLDISADLYSAPFHADSTKVTHVAIKGNRILVRDHPDWIVFDLNTGTATIFLARKKSYEVVSLNPPSRPAPKIFRYWAHPTGLMANINGQQATRYDVLCTSDDIRGHPKVSVSVVFWVVDHSPYPEFDRFRQKWAAATKLAFPDHLSGTASSAYGALAEAAGSPHPILIRVSTRSRPGEDPVNKSLPAWNASGLHSDSVEQQDDLGLHVRQALAQEATLSDFTSTNIRAEDFSIPPGFKPSN